MPPPVSDTPDRAVTADDSAAVVVTGLVKRYRTGGRRREPVTAVRGLDLSAPTGAVTALLGPNGAGKTTTVECCEGLRTPDGGTVRVLGLDPARDTRALRPRVGVMLQDGGLPSTAGAAEALAHVAAMYARPRDIAELSARLGLASFARTPVRRLSGGQRQRLALAAALVGDPEVVFLDEPSAGMDPQSRLAVWELVREVRASGTTILLTTHQMAEAEELADHVVVVDQGRVLASGTTREVVGDSGSLHVTVSPHLGRSHEGHLPGPAGLTTGLAAAVARATGGAAPEVVAVAGPAEGSTVLEVHAAVDPVVVHAVTGWAQDTGLLVTNLTSGSRTLEDVFLELTGRHLR